MYINSSCLGEKSTQTLTLKILI